eukprot:CAMPEP_0119006982 /NCGR_PEP_ID=MMETSP1176-20130426/2682_1 /TAXON_ID=265551 /ORGANISM="Synedropsis recta cf, Strain CCMP1620" /LENGTH=276 /DNA_ID=CAMNT_0006959025 /DNA_START=8 /DNA_END=838 /DNA_ORIENTATION=-
MRKPSGQRIASVVLGWPSENNENIECCAITKTIPKCGPSPSSISAATNSEGRRSMFRKKRKEQPVMEVDRSAHKYQRDLLYDQHHSAFSVDSLVRIDCRNANDEPDNLKDDIDNNEPHVDPWQVELILPHVLFKTEEHNGNWLALFPRYMLDYNDDQWAAAKRGDLKALETFMGIDWTKEDPFESTPLYYACHSGAARDIRVVRYLLDHWPGEVPVDVLSRCKKNAINASTVRMLESPEDSDIGTTIVAVTSEDFFNDDDCFGSWNIFEEDGQCQY